MSWHGVAPVSASGVAASDVIYTKANSSWLDTK